VIGPRRDLPPGMAAAAGRRPGRAPPWSEEARRQAASPANGGAGPRSPGGAGPDQGTTADSPLRRPNADMMIGRSENQMIRKSDN